MLDHIYRVKDTNIIFLCRELRCSNDKWQIVNIEPDGDSLYNDTDVIDLGEAYDFVEKYYPDYYHADEIAWEDDLYCALMDECDDEKLERIKSEWGETIEEWQSAHDDLYLGNIGAAINNYKFINNIN